MGLLVGSGVKTAAQHNLITAHGDDFLVVVVIHLFFSCFALLFYVGISFLVVLFFIFLGCPCVGEIFFSFGLSGVREWGIGGSYIG